MTSFGNEPIHTQDALIQKRKPSKIETGINIGKGNGTHPFWITLKKKSIISPKRITISLQVTWYFRYVMNDHL